MAFAQAAAQACELERVVFLPELLPRGKQHVTDITHRMALIQQTIADLPRLDALQLTAAQFTVEATLDELRTRFPDAQLTLLLGSDIVRTLPHRWKNLKILLQNAELAIGVRHGDTVEAIETILSDIEQTCGMPVRYTCVCTAKAELASSLLRAGTGDPSWLPGPEPLKYIRQHGLYPQLISTE